jgi:tripartite-type tricarboxylate transporter receptor subunit TctC
MVLVVRPGVPATTVEELVSYAKQNPGTLTYGESSAVQRAGAELFKVRTKTDIRRIPYKGSPQIITDLMGGRIDMFVSDPVTASPHIQSGALRALAVTTKSRSSALPDVTTMEEVGVADYDISGWVAAFLPTGAPPEITRKLNAAFVATLSTPEFAAFAAKTGAEPSPCSSEQLAQQVANEVEKWRTLTEIAGIEKQ